MESFPVCTECGFTFAEYQARRLLGCSKCYFSFGQSLQADLVWIHASLSFESPAINRLEGLNNPMKNQNDVLLPKSDPENLALLKRQLAEAVKIENYGEAARLHLIIKGIENSGLE